MNDVTMIRRDIQRLVEEYSILSTQKLELDEAISDEQLLEFRERLELELAFLELQTLDNDNKLPTKQVVRKKRANAEHKNKLTKKQRLCLKLLDDPYRFFADSKNPFIKFISIFIPKRKAK